MTTPNEQDTAPVETVEATKETEETSSQALPESGPEFENPDFGALSDFVNSDAEDVAVETKEQETPPEETPPEETAVETKESESEEATKEEKEAVVETKPEEEETPEKKAVEETPTEPEPEPVKMPTEEELQGMYTKHREETLPQLETLFQLTEEEANALDESPSKEIPKLAARLMYDTMLSTYNACVNALPGMMNAMLTARSGAEAAEKQFFGAWPELAKPEHKDVVAAAIRAYRGANPRATLDDLINKAGVMASIQAGLDPTKKGDVAVETTKKVAAKKPVPPAPPRGTSPLPPKKPGGDDGNLFDQLTRDMEEYQR